MSHEDTWDELSKNIDFPEDKVKATGRKCRILVHRLTGRPFGSSGISSFWPNNPQFTQLNLHFFGMRFASFEGKFDDWQNLDNPFVVKEIGLVTRPRKCTLQTLHNRLKLGQSVIHGLSFYHHCEPVEIVRHSAGDFLVVRMEIGFSTYESRNFVVLKMTRPNDKTIFYHRELEGILPIRECQQNILYREGK